MAWNWPDALRGRPLGFFGLLDRAGRVVRGGVERGVIGVGAGRFQHGVGHGTEVFAQAFHAAHQRGHRPCVQRLAAGGGGFRGAVADQTGDGLDGVAGAFDVVEVGEGDRGVLGVGFDQPGVLGEGVGLHDFLRRCGNPAAPLPNGAGGHRTRLEDRIVGTGVRLAHPCQGPPIGRAEACRP